MSDKKEPRELSVIQDEYQGLCLRAGHIQYQIFTFEKDLAMVNDQLRELNFEAASRQAKDKAKTEEEAKKASESGEQK